MTTNADDYHGPYPTVIELPLRILVTHQHLFAYLEWPSERHMLIVQGFIPELLLS